MSVPDFVIIAALIAIARWVIRSVREPGVDPPEASRKPQAQSPARPGAKPVQRTGQNRGAPGRRQATPARHADSTLAWNIVLDVPLDAPRSEIQSAARRRIAQALSGGDHAAVAHITRAAAIGLTRKRA